MLNPEDDNGNIEYKRYLINLESDRFEQLSTQMKWRLAEGNNEAIYYLGVDDDGQPYQMTNNEKKETLNNFTMLVEKNDAEIINFEVITTNNINYFKITIRKKTKILPEIRVVLMGDSQTGKTTFLSNILLSKSDHNNQARIYLMNHKHELESKKTSSFNCYYKTNSNYKFSFMEAPGSKEYQKTKYRILLGSHPDLCLLFTDKNNNINSYDLFILDNLSIPYLKINIFDETEDYYCKKLINQKIFFEKLINLYNEKTVKSDKLTRFNIFNLYPHTDLGIIMSGYLVSGNLEINKNINWINKNTIINCRIKSIHINSEPIKKATSGNILTVCIKPNKTINPSLIKKLKHGILTNQKIVSKSNINFQVLKYYQKNEIINNLPAYSENKLVYLTNIKKLNENNWEALVDNYYNEQIIIVDTDNLKAIIKIIC